MADKCKVITYIVCRRELDLQDTPDKYPDGFHVTFDVVVSAADRPRVEAASLPWEGFTAKGLGSKIVFSNKTEQQQLAAEFGKFIFIVATHGCV